MNHILTKSAKMKIKYLTLFVTFYLFVMSSPIICQIDDLPDFSFFNPTSLARSQEYNDTIPRNTKYNNGQPKLEYTIENNKLVCTVYFENGQVQLKTGIYHKLGIDTSIYTDHLTKEPIISFNKFIFDIPHGDFIEYYPSYVDRGIKSKGEYINGKRVGEWIFVTNDKKKIIANFDSDGELDGKYEEFSNVGTDNYIKTIEGQFKKIDFDVTYKSNKNSELNSYKIEEIKRVGTWNYYSIDGSLIGKADYSWK